MNFLINYQRENYFDILFFGGGGDFGVTESKPSSSSLSKFFTAGILLKTFPGAFVSLVVAVDWISKHAYEN
jgi:hypothetical protein